MMTAINQTQEAVFGTGCSMGVSLQSPINEDDERPPSNPHTCVCAFKIMIQSAWVRKVS
jgi:hypothetical protein